jgi:hypothetical protein
MWQISSGRQPFDGVDSGISLMLSILNGKREAIINGTPIKYSDLYKGKNVLIVNILIYLTNYIFDD